MRFLFQANRTNSTAPVASSPAKFSANKEYVSCVTSFLTGQDIADL